MICQTRSVLVEIARFMVAYIFLLIGFMMSFMICFADQEAFQNFPGMFIKVEKINKTPNNYLQRDIVSSIPQLTGSIT